MVFWGVKLGLIGRLSLSFSLVIVRFLSLTLRAREEHGGFVSEACLPCHSSASLSRTFRNLQVKKKKEKKRGNTNKQKK